MGVHGRLEEPRRETKEFVIIYMGSRCWFCPKHDWSHDAATASHGVAAGNTEAGASRAKRSKPEWTNEDASIRRSVPRSSIPTELGQALDGDFALALRSKQSLPEWHVWVVKFEPHKQHDNYEEGCKCLSRRTQVLVRDAGIVATARFKQLEVVVAEDPTQDLLDILERGRCSDGPNFNVTKKTAEILNPEIERDWEDYEMLLREIIYNDSKKISKHAVKRMKGNIHIETTESKVVKFVKRPFTEGEGKMAREVVLSITKFEECGPPAMSNPPFLLLHFHLNHALTPTMTLTELIRKQGKTVTTAASYVPLYGMEVRSRGVPRSTGILCEAETAGTIGSPRTINGVQTTLLEWNKQHDNVRKRLLRNAYPIIPAVGLKIKGKVYDYPPQILELVLGMKDLNGNDSKFAKCRPEQWLKTVEEIKSLLLVREAAQEEIKCNTASCKRVQLPQVEFDPHFFDPKCKYVDEPKTVCPDRHNTCFRILLVFPDCLTKDQKFDIERKAKAWTMQLSITKKIGRLWAKTNPKQQTT